MNNTANIDNTAEYIELLAKLKQEIKSTQIKASISVNSHLIELYFNMGKKIIEEQKKYNWGQNFIEKLSQDLKNEFPHMKGVSSRNLQYMRELANKFSLNEFTQQAAAQIEAGDKPIIFLIPWGHHIVLLDKNLDNIIYLWYVKQTVENGWSRNVLVHKIESKLYERSEKKISNYDITLPPEQSDLAKSFLKDPHIFGFIDECSTGYADTKVYA